MVRFLAQKSHFTLLLILFSGLLVLSAQPKGFLYEESKVLQYELPDPLICFDGLKVSDSRDCFNKRRPEIFQLFEKEVYERLPKTLPSMSFEYIEETKGALNGKGIRKQVTIYLGKKKNECAINSLLYTPISSLKPVPAFLAMNFQGNHTIHVDSAINISKAWVRNRNGIKNNRARPEDRGAAASRWAINEIISFGYALATVYYGDVDPDFHDGFKNGVHSLFTRSASEKRKSSDWGSIAGWAWGLSRCMDYLEKDPLIDSKRIGVMGHSRLGKTSLWAGATDARFAMVISNNSGCGGAVLSRRRFGETVKRINISFPNCHTKHHNKTKGNFISFQKFPS